MGIIKTEAIVIKQYDIGEADKIITFYTKDYGKIRAVAKGVRKSTSSMSGVVLPFNYNYMTFYQGRSIDKINQIKSIFSFAKLREELIKMAYATFMAEIIEKVGLENDSNQDLFSLLLLTLHHLLLADKTELDYLELAYKIKVLVILGLKPELTSCVSCNKELIYYQKNIFDIKHGGLLCKNCYLKFAAQPDNLMESFILSGEALQLFRKIITSDLIPHKNKNISSEAYQQLDELINKFITYHLELKLNSLDFLNMIKNLG